MSQMCYVLAAITAYIYQTKRDIVLKLWGCVDLRSGRVIGYIKNYVTIACGGKKARPGACDYPGRGSALQPLRFCS